MSCEAVSSDVVDSAWSSNVSCVVLLPGSEYAEDRRAEERREEVDGRDIIEETGRLRAERGRDEAEVGREDSEPIAVPNRRST